MLIYDYFKARESAFIRKKPPQKFSALLLEGKQLLDANHKHSVKCSDCKKALTWQNQHCQINVITFFMRTVCQHSDEPKIQTHV